jgi:hypothetical protein
MIDDKLGKLSNGQSTLPDRNVGDLTTIVAVELDLDNGKGVDIDFHLGCSWPYSEANLAAAIADLTKKNPKSLRPVKKKGKRLSILDEHDNRILLIRVPTKVRELSFSSLNLPITAAGKNAGLYADLKVFGPDWSPGERSLTLYNPTTNSRGDAGGVLACFTFEGSAAPAGSFVADFNIVLDWRDFDDAGNETSVAPMMFDPDTRWPEGTDP